MYQSNNRSFVRREGRISKAQKFALAHYLPDYALKLSDGQFCDDNIFPRSQPLVVEVGFGMGLSLLTQARRYPTINFIGIEVYRPGIGSLLRAIKENGVDNIRIYIEDAVLVFKQCFIDQTLDGCHIFFPDPWPKSRHHKRRLIQADFINLLANKLTLGGVLHLATDWQHYADHMMQVIASSQHFDLMNQLPSSDSFYLERPMTKFEKRGLNLGHKIFDLRFIRRS